MASLFGNLFGSSTGTTTSQSSPWSVQQPFLADTFQQANQLYNRGAYQGPFIGQQSPFTVQYQNMAAQSATDPRANPYLGAFVNDALGQVRSQFNSQYGGPAGQNVNNSGFQEQLARTLGNVALPIYANAYNQGLSNLQAAGQSQEARSQAEAEAQQQAYMSPWSNLANYRNAIAGAYGGTQQTPYYTNNSANTLGLGIGAASLYSLLSQ